MGVASGVVVNNIMYIDFLILLIPTPLVSFFFFFFLSNIRTFCSFF